MMHIIAAFVLLSYYVVFTASSALADTFGRGDNSLEIEFVTIGNLDNSDDMHGQPRPAGKVEYAYRIGKYEISEDIINKANAVTAGSPNPLNITHTNRGPDKPATFISWFEAAKFVNWLNTSKNHVPAYKFDDDGFFHLWEPSDVGYNPENLYRNSLSIYFLPSVDEWYKAAYYDPDGGGYFSYATGSSTLPTPVSSGTEPNTAVYDQPPAAGPADVKLAGGLSPYGTMGQTGNVVEWEETAYFLENDSASASRGIRGGDWDSEYRSGSYIVTPLWKNQRALSSPWAAGYSKGFRVASIPEPNTFTLWASVLAGLLVNRGIGCRFSRLSHS